MFEQHGAQQLLGGNAGATAFEVGRLHASQHWRHLEQRLVDHEADGTQWMVDWSEVFQVAQSEQALVESVGADDVWRCEVKGKIGLSITFQQGKYGLQREIFQRLRETDQTFTYSPLNTFKYVQNTS